MRLQCGILLTTGVLILQDSQQLLIPSQQGYKHEKKTFLETAILAKLSNTCGLCFSDIFGIELYGTLNPLSYKTGLSVDLSVSVRHLSG